VRDLIAVNDLDTVDDLVEKLARLPLFHSLLRNNEIEHFTSENGDRIEW